jgi:Haem-NO-binding
MYGIVNKAIESMVKREYGAQKWQLILNKAGFQTPYFVSNKSYPDKLTYDLVAAASQVLETPAELILEGFGIYWSTHLAVEEYPELMENGGGNLTDFLFNLPNFHTQISLMLPELRPPNFHCEEHDHGICLHYYSQREGLSPFLVGIIKGLGQVFDEAIKIEQVEFKGTEIDHDVFLISWQIADLIL